MITSPVPIHKAIIENGELKWLDRMRLVRWLSTLKGDVEIIIRKKFTPRSSKQNRYYWAYLNIISNDTGETTEDLHELFKRKFLPPRFKIILGVEIKLPASTKELNSTQFSEYIMRIESLTGIPAPDPNEYYYA